MVPPLSGQFIVANDNYGPVALAAESSIDPKDVANVSEKFELEVVGKGRDWQARDHVIDRRDPAISQD